MKTQREKEMTLARAKINSLVRVARQEIERHGMRENLGYDLQNKLRDYVEKYCTHINYVDECNIYSEFIYAIDHKVYGMSFV